MKKLLFSMLVCVSFANAQPVIEQQIPDDEFVEVPLQFAFPYYGQVFTTSWMFDNGVVGFYSPFSGYNGGQNYYSQPFEPNMTGQYSYMIAPLWTDLVNYSGTFTTQGNPQFQRYNWNNISQWGYPENLNTFSLEIRPSGEILATYDQVNISGYPVSIGMTGDVTQNEFQQIFYAAPESMTNSVSNWQYNTVPVNEPTYDIQDIIESSMEPETTVIEEIEVAIEETEESAEEEDKPLEEKTTLIARTPVAQSQNKASAEEFVLSNNQLLSGSVTDTAGYDNQDITENKENAESIVLSNSEVIDEQETVLVNAIVQNSDILSTQTQTATTTFNNNMQQVLALGGTITQILNTPVPDFSRFDIKTPTQEEQVQTVKVENTIESMNAEDIESQAELLAGSMDLQAQAIALQLIGYKAGFDQYGGTIQDQQNWYQSTSVYSNNRVPAGSNQLFGAQDQRHQELMSLQYRR